MHVLLEVKIQNDGFQLLPSSRKIIRRGRRRGAMNEAGALLHIGI